jgi:hypothetical protein
MLSLYRAEQVSQQRVQQFRARIVKALARTAIP